MERVYLWFVKISSTALAVVFAAALTAPAHAADGITLYISEKISHSKIKVSNPGTRPLPATTNLASYGTNEKDNLLGSRTAIGFVFPVSAIRGSLRAEFEFGFNEKAKFDIANKEFPSMIMNTKMKVQTYFINAYYDFDTKSAFTPYIGIGAGIANIKGRAVFDYGAPGGDMLSGSARVNNFAWNASLGGVYAFNKNLSFDIGYRHTDLGNFSGTLTSPDDAHKMKAKLSSHEVLLGLRYSF